MEIGTSLEDAVRREVAEEAGVTVGDVKYGAAQPWLFSSRLMVGRRRCGGRAGNGRGANHGGGTGGAHGCAGLVDPVSRRRGLWTRQSALSRWDNGMRTSVR